MKSQWKCVAVARGVDDPTNEQIAKGAMNVMKVGERAHPELTGDTLEEARSFLELLRAERVIDTQTYRRRLGQISCAVGRHGHYRMESLELEHACRVAWRQSNRCIGRLPWKTLICLLYTSDAADEEDSVDLGGRRIIKKKTET